ncbi:VOC family protein [Leucobacter weissii]|uniref:VOC family protein n=1 Tax=Leucobacter weissii TaxID=1983706 RepID=A0A939MSW5_9MICO|nr:VOC family protein [Leucobacter weissii]
MSALGDGDLDHVVVVTGSLRAAADRIAAAVGVRPAFGGRHPGNGSANLILALTGAGGGAYLEVLGPDPEETRDLPPERTFFGIDLRREPVPGRVLTWARRSDDIEAEAARIRATGIEVGRVQSLGRRRDDGTELRWRLTRAPEPQFGGAFPFLIDWGGAPHPSADAPPVRLIALHADVAETERLAARSAGVALPPAGGAGSPLSVTIAGPGGSLTL